MTILPIATRELRVGSRKKLTHALRFGLGALAFLMVVVITVALRAVPSSMMGPIVFHSVGFVLFCYAVAAGCLHTSDCLGSEKRQGILGLLFLTDLHGYDIALGKLVSASLQSMYALIAVLPVLALAILMGGVTFGEFARLTLVLVLTMGWSLSLGLLVSSFVTESRHAVTLAGCLVFALALLPWFAWQFRFVLGTNPASWWEVSFCLSPAIAYILSSDAAFQSSIGFWRFWTATATQAGMILGAVAVASWQVRRCWRHTGDGQAWVSAKGRSFWTKIRLGGKRRDRNRRTFLDKRPYQWLVGRDRLSPILTWIFLLLLVPLWLLFFQKSVLNAIGGSPRTDWVAFNFCLVIGFFMHAIVKYFLIAESVRQVCHDAESHALEMLLVTPLSERSILEEHRNAVWKKFAGPFFVLIATNLCLFTSIVAVPAIEMDDAIKLPFALLFMGGIVFVLLDAMAIVPYGLWMGMKHGRARKAAWMTRLTVYGPPYGIVFVAILGMILGGPGGGVETMAVILFVFFCTSLIIDLLTWQSAQDGLTHLMRSAASGDEAEPPMTQAPTLPDSSESNPEGDVT